MPELQLFILRFLVQLALDQPRVLEQFEQSRIYDLLLGPFFLGLIKAKYKKSTEASAAAGPMDPTLESTNRSLEEEEAAYKYACPRLRPVLVLNPVTVAVTKLVNWRGIGLRPSVSLGPQRKRQTFYNAAFYSLLSTNLSRITYLCFAPEQLQPSSKCSK